MLAEVSKTIAKKGIDLVVSDDAKQHLIEEGYDEAMGVRPLRRVIEQEIRDKITDSTLITQMLNTLKLIWLTENLLSAKNKPIKALQFLSTRIS